MSGKSANGQTMLDVDDLDAQLEQLRKRCIYRTFDQGMKELDLPVLFRIAETLKHDDWASGDPDRMMAAIASIVEAAIGQLRGLGNIQGREISWEQAARILYNFETPTHSVLRQINDYKTTKQLTLGKEFEQLTAWLKILLRTSPKADVVDREIIPEVRRKIALRLLEREEIFNTSQESTFEPGYVSRQLLQEEVLQAFRDGHNVILLYGDTGTGKSSLARAIATLVLGGYESLDSVVIEAATNDDLDTSIRRFLLSTASNSFKEDAHPLKYQFRQLLASEEAPGIVILDNIQNDEALKKFLPASPRRPILVTSRSRLSSDVITCRIYVENMLEDEAVQLTLEIASNISADDAIKLAAALEYRPLAIIHGCKCMKESPFDNDVEAFLEELWHDSDILDSYGVEADLTLASIYTMTIDQLRSHKNGEDILRVLDLIVTLGPTFTTDMFDVLPLFFRVRSGNLEYQEESRSERARFNKTVRILEERGLIRPSEFPVMHWLTASIISSIRATEINRVIHDCFVTFSKHLDFTDWGGGCPPPNRKWPFIALEIDNLKWTIFHLFGTAVVEHEETGYMLDGLTAVMLRQFREWGALSADIRQEIEASLQIGLVRQSSLAKSNPLYREALDLGYLQSSLTDNGESILMILASRGDQDLATYALISSSFMHPFVTFTEMTEDLNNSNPTIKELERTPQLSDWRRLFAFRLRMGVANLQLARWSESREWLDCALDLCFEQMEEHPEARSMMLDCVYRIIELGLFSRDHEACHTASLVAQYFILEVVIDGELSLQVDPVAFHKYLLQINVFLSEQILWAIGRRDIDLDKLSRTRQAIYDQGRRFDDWAIDAWHFESEFHYLRSHLYDVNSRELLAPRFAELGKLCRSRGHKVGYLICALAMIKLDIAADEEPDMEVRIHALQLIASELEIYKSIYWHADTLNTLYLLTMVAGRSDDEIALARHNAVEALSSIGRVDRLDLADTISANRKTSPLLLLL